MAECPLARALIIGGKRCLKGENRRNDRDSARDSASPTLDFRAQKIQTVTRPAFSANPRDTTAVPFGVIGLSRPRGFKTFRAVLVVHVLPPKLPPIPGSRRGTHPGRTDRAHPALANPPSPPQLTIPPPFRTFRPSIRESASAAHGQSPPKG